MAETQICIPVDSALVVVASIVGILIGLLLASFASQQPQLLGQNPTHAVPQLTVQRDEQGRIVAIREGP